MRTAGSEKTLRVLVHTTMPAGNTPLWARRIARRLEYAHGRPDHPRSHLGAGFQVRKLAGFFVIQEDGLWRMR